jgi:hypothetical protein
MIGITNLMIGWPWTAITALARHLTTLPVPCYEPVEREVEPMRVLQR